MNVIGYILIGFLFSMLDYIMKNEINEKIQKEGYIKKSRYEEAKKYASSNIVSIERSNNNKIISSLKIIIYFIPILNALKLILSFCKCLFTEEYTNYLKKHNKLLDVNSKEACFTFDTETKVESLYREKVDSFLEKIKEFIDHNFPQHKEEDIENNDVTEDVTNEEAEQERIEFRQVIDAMRKEREQKREQERRDLEQVLESMRKEKEQERRNLEQVLESMRKEKEQERRNLEQVLESMRKEKEQERRNIQKTMEEYRNKKAQERRDLEQYVEIIRKNQEHIFSSQEDEPKKLKLDDSFNSYDNKE